MKNKGFTMTELVTVLVFLGIILIGLFIGISVVVNKDKEINRESFENILISASKVYQNANKDNKKEITTKELIEQGFLDKNIEVPDNKNINNYCIEIKDNKYIIKYRK